MKHPYHSSKFRFDDCLEKPGTGIFLMKESAKLVKEQRQRTSFTLAKRLQPEEEKAGEPSYDGPPGEKKKKLADGSAQVVNTSSQQSIQPQRKL